MNNNNNYKLIIDENALIEFVDWLPTLESSEKYFISLLARRKYNTDGSLSNLKADKNQLKRVTCTKDRIVEKIRQMETAYGSYLNAGVPIQQENLCLYITPNPRDSYKAGINLLKELANKISIDDRHYNPQSLALNCIQTSCSRKIFFDLDVDIKKDIVGFQNKQEILGLVLNDLIKIINHDCLNIIETNGGYHILIKVEDIDPQYNKSWYQNISKIKSDYYEITMNGDNLIPVVGCFQGGFVPKIIR
jgi:hypothetical protein